MANTKMSLWKSHRELREAIMIINLHREAHLPHILVTIKKKNSAKIDIYLLIIGR
jgi:hypothetical protein